MDISKPYKFGTMPVDLVQCLNKITRLCTYKESEPRKRSKLGFPDENFPCQAWNSNFCPLYRWPGFLSEQFWFSQSFSNHPIFEYSLLKKDDRLSQRCCPLKENLVRKKKIGGSFYPLLDIDSVSVTLHPHPQTMSALTYSYIISTYVVTSCGSDGVWLPVISFTVKLWLIELYTFVEIRKKKGGGE